MKEYWATQCLQASNELLHTVCYKQAICNETARIVRESRSFHTSEWLMQCARLPIIIHTFISTCLSTKLALKPGAHSEKKASGIKIQFDLPSTKRRLLRCISYLLWWICCGVFLTCRCDRFESSNLWHQEIKWCKVWRKLLNLACEQ